MLGIGQDVADVGVGPPADGPLRIWLLAARTRDLVGAGAIDGWIPEHGSNGGFEQWDFLSHIYEIAGPEPESAYIAFIPAVDGSWGIRRKWFTADAGIRREELTGGLDLGPDPDLRAVIRDRNGLAASWGDCYRRVRYNVLLESLRSGHVFSVMFDRCTDAAGQVPDLHQAEVEYIRSRVISGRPDDDLMDEFGQLCVPGCPARSAVAAARSDASSSLPVMQVSRRKRSASGSSCGAAGGPGVRVSFATLEPAEAVRFAADLGRSLRERSTRVD